MQIAILLHDLGKPISKDKKITQKVAGDFLSSIEFPEGMKKILLAFIGKHADLAHQYFIDKNQEKYKELYQETSKLLDTHDPDVIQGWIHLCKKLLECDGGAYTPMSITRDKINKTLFRNDNPRFEESFKNPQDPMQRNIKLKEE